MGIYPVKWTVDFFTERRFSAWTLLVELLQKQN